MPTLRLSWRDRNSGDAEEEGFRVYRDTAPIDPDDLPVPLTTLPPGSEEYEDDSVAAATTYYYAVSAFRDDLEAVLVFDPFETAP
jgi:hypothetical protein